MEHGRGQTEGVAGLSFEGADGMEALPMTKLLAAVLAGALGLALPALALPSLVLANTQATVNVNTAQQSELQSLQGLDRNAARSIILYRNRNGP